MKHFIAWCAGLAAMLLSIFIVEFTGHLIWPPPETLSLSEPDMAKSLIQTLPIAAKLTILLAWGMGGLFAGFFSAALAPSHRRWLALSLGLLLTVLIGVNVWMIPHPLWMSIVAMMLPLPSSWLGHRMASKHRPSTTTHNHEHSKQTP